MILVQVLMGSAFVATLGLAPWMQRPFLFEVGRWQWPLFRWIRGGRNVFLTFDDGPDPENTPRLLDMLERKGARATFFVVTENARRYPSLTREILKRGHSLGSHGYSHKHLFFRRRITLQREVADAVDELEQIVSRTIWLFRPPYGVRGPALYRVLRQLGLRPVFWDVLTYDWRNPPSHRIAARAGEKARPGSIILLHDGGGSRQKTIDAIPEIVERLRAKALDITTMTREGREVDQ